MSFARDRILGEIRKRTEKNEPPSRLRARLKDPPVHTIPARARRGEAERLSLFVRMAELAKAEVVRIKTPAAFPEEVRRLLAERGLPPEVLASREPALLGLPWAAAGLRLRHGRAGAEDRTGVALALAGVAETGGLLFAASPASPMTLHLLCDLHVVLLPEERLCGTAEEAFHFLSRSADGALPSAVTLVTGPSRTADIEQRIALGAHGPREVHIVLAGRAAR